MARTQKKHKKLKKKMKHIQSLYYHEKKSEAEGKFLRLVNRYSALEKNQGHKPKGIMLNFMIRQLEKALSRESRKIAKTA